MSTPLNTTEQTIKGFTELMAVNDDTSSLKLENEKANHLVKERIVDPEVKDILQELNINEQILERLGKGKEDKALLLISSCSDILESKPAEVLCRAATNNLSRVINLCRQREVTLKGRDCCDEFFAAASLANLRALKTLVEFGADPTVVRDKTNALHHALSGLVETQERTDTVKFLIDNEVDVNFQDKVGNSPLHYATERSLFQIVKILIEKGAKADVLNHKSQSPLYHLIREFRPNYYTKQHEPSKELLETVALLLTHGASVPCSGEKQGYMLWDLCIKLSDKGRPYLHIEPENREIVRLFLKKGFNQNRIWRDGCHFEGSFLHFITSDTDLESIRILVNRKADLTFTGRIVGYPYRILEGNPLEIFNQRFAKLFYNKEQREIAELLTPPQSKPTSQKTSFI